MSQRPRGIAAARGPPAFGWSSAAGAHCLKPHDCAAVADRTGPTREPSPGRPFCCLCARRISNHNPIEVKRK